MTKVLRLLAALLLAIPVFAQAQRTGFHSYSQAELHQMLAPVALYPDALLSQVLMAATYPAEVSEAARWSRNNPGLQGDGAVRAVEYENWDPSVKSLVAFPQLLARMDEKLDWTLDLGDAFLAQEPQVMDTVQQLRRRARAAGNLQSSEQLHVQQQGQTILVQPASPQIIYVPYYDPLVVYGPWWWPAYRPVYWAPWPRSYGIHVSLGFFFGTVDWHRRHVRVVNVNNYYYRPPVIVNRSVVDRGHWQHKPRRREVVVDRQPIQVRPQVQAQPAVRMQTPPAARVQVQAVPQAQNQTQPPARTHPVLERHEARHEHRAPPVRAQAPTQVQPQVRMPAAVAPQQPRAERQERRETRQEPRHERGPKGRERS